MPGAYQNSAGERKAIRAGSGPEAKRVQRRERDKRDKRIDGECELRVGYVSGIALAWLAISIRFADPAQEVMLKRYEQEVA